LRNGSVFANDFAPASSDGIRVDDEGNVWSAVAYGDPAEDGVRCYTPGGDVIAKLHLPEGVANLCFGGVRRNRLFIAGASSIYALFVGVSGNQRP
jgi:gluconolactonase